jgi:bifunctional DNA-binding transcriptional regulator/antitoxin component of YhaV-PrlF toxin-antitoxin module
MKATIDPAGRITLGKDLQTHLGVQPGDEVLLENRGDEWFIKASKPNTGLCLEGNVLVHRGVHTPRNDDLLAVARDERHDQLCEGLRQ